MNEQFLATFGQNLYPEHKEVKVMLEGVSSEESQQPLEDDGEKKTVRQKEKQAIEKERGEGKKGKEKSKREVQEERRKLEELRAILEKAATGAKEAMERAAKATPEATRSYEGGQVELGQDKPLVIKASNGESIVVGSVEKHLENLPREEVVRILSVEGIKLPVPDKWDAWPILSRRKWLSNHGYYETTKFPESVLETSGQEGFQGELETLYKDDEKNVQVSRAPDGKLYLVGVSDMRSETIEDLLKKAKVDKKLKFPKDWPKKTFKEQQKWLRERGVGVIPEIAGGAHWGLAATAHRGIDLETTIRRLVEIGDPVSFVGHSVDSEQLFNRLRVISNNFENLPPQILRTALEVNYQLERNFATTGTAFPVQFSTDRDILHRLLMEKGNLSTEAILQAMKPRVGLGARDQMLVDHFDRVVAQIRRGNVPDNRRYYRTFYNFMKAVETQEIILGSSGRIADLDAILSPPDRVAFKRVRDDMHKDFKAEDEQLKKSNPALRKRLVLELEDLAGTLKSAKKMGFGGIQNLTELEEGIWQGASDIIARNPEYDASRDFIRWSAIDVYRNIENQILHEGDLGPPARWEDSLNNVKRNLRFVEAADLPVEQLQQAIGRIVQTMEQMALPQMTDPDERARAEKMRAEIEEIKAAVEAIYVLRQTMESSSMNPEKVVGVFERPQWTDKAFKDYFKRFEEDTRGEEFKDTRDNKFNLLDKSMQLYFKKFREERRDMNLSEGLTVVDISRAFVDRNDRRVRTIENLLDRELDPEEFVRLEVLRQNFLKRLTDLRRRDPEAGWQGTRNVNAMKGIVNDWLREETLLGAHGFAEDGKTRNLDVRKFGGVLKGVRERGIRDQLREYLENNLDFSGRGVGSVKELLDEYEQAGLLDQVVNDAYYMTWMWGAFSELSFVRVWDTDKEWFVDDRGFKHPRLGGYAYNQDSRIWYGRMVDTYPEFLLDERRGKPGIGKDLDANFVFQRNMVGRTKGILNHNRLLTKMIVDNLTQDKNFKNSLVYDPTGRGVGNYDRVVHERAVHLDGIDKLNIGELKARHEEFSGGREYDQNWARGVAVAELMEEGKLSLENIEWSKVFTHPDANISMYNMADWWDDREKAAKYFGARQTAFQKYMQQPNTKTFLELNSIDLFYSGREPRIKSWMKLAIPAHIDLGRYWKRWWRLEENMAHSEKEDIIDVSVRSNALDERDVDEVKRKHLGWGSLPGYWWVRNPREYLQGIAYFSKESGKRSWTWPFIMFGEFWKQLTKYLGAGFSS